MEEKIFVSYVGMDFSKRFEDVFEMPFGIFEKECKHGYLWCIALNIVDPAQSLTQMMLTAANSAAMFFVFASSDYRKIDKLKWEHDITTGEHKNHDVYDYINDEIEDKYAEFIASRDDLKPIYIVCSGSTLAPRYDQDIFGLDMSFLKSFPEQTKAQIRKAFQNGYYGIKEFNDKYHITSGKNIVSSTNNNLDEQEKEAAGFVSATMFYFTAVLAPIILISAANYERHKQGLQLLGFNALPGNYLNKFGYQLMLDRLNSVRYFGNACEGGKDKYDIIFNNIYSYFDFEKQIILSDKAKGIGRNDLCPCGSGKKWKSCCGKRH